MIKDLIIIGAGPGGYELALAAGKKGLDTLLIEKNKLGGTCLHHGCIPTKTYFHSAKILKEAKSFSDFGIIGDFKFDFSKVKQKKAEVVSNLESGINFQFKKSNVQLVFGEAKLISDTEVLVNDEVYKGTNIVIATGSSPAKLNIQGINSKDVITSTELLDINTPPKKLVVIGGGVIGIELASIFNMFGSEVEVIEAQSEILSVVDKEITKRLQTYLKTLEIKFYLNSKVLGLEGNEIYFENKGEVKSSHFDKVLVAVGRRPNVDNLGLDEVGIIYSKHGIDVNDYFQTNIPNIYAIGDVTGKLMLAHSATYMGYQVLSHILGEDTRIDFNLNPSCIFTFPEVATVGLTEEEAKGLDYKVTKFLFKANGKAHSMGNTDGFLKLISCDDKILGVHIIGPSASELIHEAVTLMSANVSIKDAKNIIFAHPTLSEVVSGTIIEI